MSHTAMKQTHAVNSECTILAGALHLRVIMTKHPSVRYRMSCSLESYSSDSSSPSNSSSNSSTYFAQPTRLFPLNNKLFYRKNKLNHHNHHQGRDSMLSKMTMNFQQVVLVYIHCWASRHSLGFEDEDLGSSPGWWAATVATYCPRRPVELPKFLSSKPWE